MHFLPYFPLEHSLLFNIEVLFGKHYKNKLVSILKIPLGKKSAKMSERFLIQFEQQYVLTKALSPQICRKTTLYIFL